MRIDETSRKHPPTKNSWLKQFIMESCAKSMCLEVACNDGAEQGEESKTQDKPLTSQATTTSDSSPNPHQAQQQQLRGSRKSLEQESGNEDRPFDVVIFGASSSVGKFLVEEMALVVEKYYSDSSPQQHQSPTSNIVTSTMNIRELRDPMQFVQSTARRRSVPRHLNNIKWAVAGRSAMRLSETLCRAELSTGIKDLSLRLPVILADLNQHKSLLDMCSKTSLVINCAGPYSIDGEAVVRACLETRTNYIDLAHETHFIEQMRQKYSDEARRTGIYIINGCGFQSMSAEMGLNFTKQVTDGQIEEVKIIFNLSDTKALIRPSGSNTQMKPCGIVSWGMWCSLLLDRAQVSSESSSSSSSLGPKESTTTNDQQVADDPQPGSSSQQHQQKQLRRKDTQTLVKDVVELRNRHSFAWLQLFKGFNECGRNYCLPINGLTSEESQLISGEMSNYKHRKPDMDSTKGWRPIRCTSFMSMKSLVEVVVFLFWLIIFNLLVKFTPLRNLMRVCPSVSSLGHVNGSKRELDRDSLGHIKFCQTFLAYGTPGDDSGDPLEQREKHTRRKQEQLLVARIVGPEPNHVATATYAIQAALALVLEKDHLPPGGGVLTPGSAFSETNIIYQLRRRNIKFEVMKKA